MLYNDPDSAFGLVAGRVVVQVRWGTLSQQTLQDFEAIAEPLLQFTDGSPFGALMLVEPTAAVASLDVREAQKVLIARWLARENLFMAVVTAGDDVQATLKRAVSRLLVTGNPRLRHFPTFADASTWMVEKLSDLAITNPALHEARNALLALKPEAP